MYRYWKYPTYLCYGNTTGIHVPEIIIFLSTDDGHLESLRNAE